VEVRLLIPYNRYEMVRMVYEQGSVAEKENEADGVRLRASVPAALATRLAPFVDTRPEPAAPAVDAAPTGSA